jgi:2-amino-4-hydroxy-6-hydroxymethyldihydropteridine diphosphokinase
MHRFIILMGSNLPDPARILEAQKCLISYLGKELRFSSIHQSRSVTKMTENKPAETNHDYYNAVCTGQTAYSYDQLNSWLKNTERSLGREWGAASNGLVAIDLDLVEWDKQLIRPNEAEQTYYLTCLADL